MLAALLAACALLAVGAALRMTVKPLRVLYLPASVVAGLLGFILVQWLTRVPAAGALTTAISQEWSGWPGPLVAVVFAALLMERSEGGGLTAALRRGARSGLLAWIIILGQVAIGALVYLTLVAPAYAGVPATFSQLLEVSWAGGHGTSAGMAQVFAAQDWSAGKDVAFFLATFGLVYGVVSGLVLVNLAIRRGWVAKLPPEETGDAASAAASAAPRASYRDAIAPLTLQVVFLGLAFLVGFGLHQVLLLLARMVLGPDDPAIKGQAIDAVGNLPLFLFTLLAGGLVRWALGRLKLGHLVEVTQLRGLVGVAMDFLIVAAIATLRMEALSAFFLPIAALIVGAGVWSTFCLLVLSPRLLPRAYWFELGLLNYGFSTANTPQGFMLLRIIDPDLRSGAAEDYAVAAPLSAPFVGGGIITFVVFPLLLGQWGAAAMAGVCMVGILGCYALGRKLARPG